MDINVTIKCPDLPLAASALAKAIVGIAPTAHSDAVDLAGMAKKLEETPAQIMTPQPTMAPVAPAQAPVAANPTPVAAPTQTTVAPPAPTGAVTAPTPAVPVTPAPQITGDVVAKAGADLIAANPTAMGPLNALLQKYGVSCAQELRPDQIGPFTTEMRALGARL